MATHKLKVGVLCGGFSGERSVSLRSGENVAKHLSREKYEVWKIDVKEKDVWHIFSDDGKETILDLTTDEGKQTLKNFDIFFNALHGAYGEDGELQTFLDTLGVRYTGSGAAASKLAMDKVRAMEKLQTTGALVPEFFFVKKEDDLSGVREKVEKSLGYPVIIKPNDSGSTLGLTLAQDATELEAGVEKALAESETAILQRYIAGREFTCGVLGKSGGKLEALLPIEIVIANQVFDFEDKYFSKETKEICPAQVDDVLLKKIQDFAVLAHETLGCDGLSRSDFRMDETGDVYYLETNTSPGMTETSLCPKEALTAGLTMGEFLDKIIDLSLMRKTP